VEEKGRREEVSGGKKRRQSDDTFPVQSVHLQKHSKEGSHRRKAHGRSHDVLHLAG
jgi:hypothetical protein